MAAQCGICGSDDSLFFMDVEQISRSQKGTLVEVVDEIIICECCYFSKLKPLFIGGVDG